MPESSGSAMMVMLAMLAIVGLLVVANTRTVNWVRAEVRLIDQRESAGWAPALPTKR